MKVALLLPGYLDSPNYLHMMIFEKRLKELGYLVERVDPCNLWTSGNIDSYTITNFLKQIKERANFYNEQNLDEITLIGHSQGAMVAIIAGSKISSITKIVALCPPDSRKDSAHKWGKNKVRVSKRDLPNNPDKFREFAVPYSYIEDASNYSASEAVKELRKPLMIFIALEDTVVPPDITEKIVENANEPYVVRQPSMGHDFRLSRKESEIVMSQIENFLK
jgi:pimeloyl-ACP methyl ester carboxylesterase